MNIADRLLEVARAFPGRNCLIERVHGRTSTLTFSQLNARADALASQLVQAGVAGETVLLLHRMDAELYVVLLALFKIGSPAMFLDPSFPPPLIKRCFQLCRPQALVTSSSGAFLQFISPEIRAIPARFTTGGPFPGLEMLSCHRRDGDTTCRHNLQLDPDTPALITFTSGSTGMPKAVVRSHAFLQRQLDSLRASLQLKLGEVDLTPLPIFVLANLASGITSVIPNTVSAANPNPANIVRQLVEYKVTRCTAAPLFLSKVAGYLMQRHRQLPHLNKVFTGGGPVFPRLLSDLAQVMPNAEIKAVYGSSEAEPIAAVAKGELGDREYERIHQGAGLLAGYPEAGITVAIVPLSDLPPRALGPNEIGEVVVTGDRVIKTYLGGQGDRETKFRWNDEVWHRSGDAGYFDEHGRLWLVGRCDAVCHDARGTLFPFQVEAAALEHRSIRRAAFVSVKGKRMLVVEPSRLILTDHEVGLLRKDLNWAQIDQIHIVNRIPTDARHNSKVLYAKLAKQLG